MAKLTEDIGKELLHQHGIIIPKSMVAFNSTEARNFAEDLNKEVVVKALVPTGRRGKAKAVRFANSPELAQKNTDELLEMEIYGYKIKKVLVEERINIEEEYYLSFTFDSMKRCPVLLASREGGVEIEDVVARTPEKLVKHHIDYLRGLPIYDALEIWEKAGLAGKVLTKTAQLTCQLYEFFIKNDVLMAEFNPIALTKEGEVLPAAIMLDIDDAALFRHPYLSDKVKQGAGRVQRLLTEREIQVINADLAEPGKGAIRYTELENGEIGLCVAGGGAGLLQHDLILKYGGKPANHTDVTPGPIQNKLKALFRAILTKPGVKSLLVSSNVIQLFPVTVYTEALVSVIKELKIDPNVFPIVVRLAGPEEDEGKKMLDTIPGIHYYSDNRTLEEVVKLIVELTEKAKRGELV